MTEAVVQEKSIQKIPRYLIRDEIDGVPYYYKNYKSILSNINNKETFEDIIGASTLQSVVIQSLLKNLFQYADVAKYWILTNEIGGHIAKGINLSFDIAIFDKDILTIDKINERYADVPPKVVFEIDVKIDVENKSDWNYISEKTEKILAFGTEQVIWIFTQARNILVANNDNWLIVNWDTDISVFDHHSINLQAMLVAEGLK